MSQSLFDWTGHGGHDPDKHQQLMEYANMITNKELLAAGFVASPNNIWGRDGQAWYYGTQGGINGKIIPVNQELRVISGIAQIQDANKPGPVTDIPSIPSLLNWIEEHGVPAPPPGPNVWD